MTGPVSPAKHALRPLTKPALTGLIFSLLATAWCAWAAGTGLALFFGAILLTAFYVPALTLAEPPQIRWIPPIASTLGIAICWTASLHAVDVSATELLRCVLVCLSYTFAIAGFASLLSQLRLAPAPAAFFVTLTVLLWLTWPVWLSHALNQTRVNILSPAHPLLALNGVLRHLGAWDRATLAYQRLTVLNQDIPYTLPRSIFPTVALHTLIAAACFSPSALRPRRTTGMVTSADL
jgi:hypothetical protein